MKAMILAAGFGSRMAPLNNAIPKPLLPILGRPLLEWNLRYLAANGIDGVVVNTHHLAREVERWTKTRLPSSFELGGKKIPTPDVRLVHEPMILGTAGGLANAASLLDGDPNWILNVDLLFQPDLSAAEKVHEEGKYLATLVLVRDPNFAKVRLTGNRIDSIAVDANPSDRGLLAFTGMYLLSREALLLLPRGGFAELPPFLRQWAKKGQLGGYIEEDAPFREVGTLESYLEIHRDLSGPLSRRLLTGDPDPDIDPASGFGFIDHGAAVGEGVHVEESVVLAGAILDAGADIRRSIVGPGAHVSEFLRTAAVSGDDRRKMAWLPHKTETAVHRFLDDNLGAFESAVLREGEEPRVRTLKGDGSHRQILRTTIGASSRIVVVNPPQDATDNVVYPKRVGTGVPDENETFVYVAEFLRSRGVGAPEILAFDKEAGLLLLEDLGATHLFDRMEQLRSSPEGKTDGEIESLYRAALELLIRMQDPGADPFDPARVFNVDYDAPFILRYESGYFQRTFVETYAQLDPATDALTEEYERLARLAVEGVEPGFMHRDFQSRNLLVARAGVHVIDFQGARLGPPAYDVASLLFDPYVDLDDVRERLLDYYVERTCSTAESRTLFLERYPPTAINRLLQALGAFGYLGGELGKEGFLEYAPVALERVAALAEGDYPHLCALVDRLRSTLYER